MKILFVLPLVLAMTVSSAVATPVQPLNAVIGDESYLATYGHLPTKETPEETRITTHLKYVYEKLSRVDSGDLPPHLQAARVRNLERLREYAEQGRYPINNVCSHRRVPIFVDDRGTRCAVGYLAEQDLGARPIMTLAGKFRYDYLPDIDSPALAEWQTGSGLTPIELAMIQPAYGANVSCQLNATVTPCPLTVCPAGDTGSFLSQGWSLDIWVYDESWVPIPNIPASDFWLIDCDPLRDVSLCGGFASSNADAPTNANGKTTMSQSTMIAGGCADGVSLVVQGYVVMDSLTGNTTEKCFAIAVRSPDIDASLTVDLVDLALFAASYPPNSFDACCDMDADGLVNLVDMALFAPHFGPPGHTCN